MLWRLLVTFFQRHSLSRPNWKCSDGRRHLSALKWRFCFIFILAVNRCRLESWNQLHFMNFDHELNRPLKPLYPLCGEGLVSTFEFKPKKILYKRLCHQSMPRLNYTVSVCSKFRIKPTTSNSFFSALSKIFLIFNSESEDMKRTNDGRIFMDIFVKIFVDFRCTEMFHQVNSGREPDLEADQIWMLEKNQRPEIYDSCHGFSQLMPSPFSFWYSFCEIDCRN